MLIISLRPYRKYHRRTAMKSGIDGPVADLLLRISTLTDDIPEVREVVCDPILASVDGAAVLNARIRVGPVPDRRDTGPRRLG